MYAFIVVNVLIDQLLENQNHNSCSKSSGSAAKEIIVIMDLNSIKAD